MKISPEVSWLILSSIPFLYFCSADHSTSSRHQLETASFCTASVLPEELTNQIPWLYCWPPSPEDGSSWFRLPLLRCPVFWVTQACVSGCSIIYHKIGLFLSESQWDQWRPFRWEKESMFINIDSKEERGVETFYCIKKDIFKDALIEGC